MKSRGFLLDTSVFIWLMEGNDRLPAGLVRELADPKMMVWVSTASIWELVIKKRILGLKIPDIIDGIKSARLEILSINADHVLEIDSLGDFHRDPFDRMLIAQSRVETLRLVTSDKKFKQYEVDLLEID